MGRALYPVTYEGMKTVWRRTARRLGIALRFHDTRHTAATRLLRRTGNLKLAQQLLGHADIKTTAKFYAHVMVDDLRRALDATSSTDKPHKRDSRYQEKTNEPKQYTW